jgi:DNA-binding NarL/FixJ family response regulator
MGRRGETIRVLLADHQAMVRSGLRLVLESDPGLSVVGEVKDGAEAVREALRLEPDVVVMETWLPVVDGIEAVRRLDAAGSCVPVLLLAAYEDDDLLFQALSAGAGGFLLTSGTAADLVRAVRTVAAGEALLSPELTRRVIDSFADPRRPLSTADTLTPREVEVFRLLARGLTNAEIAERLVLGAATVKTHVARVMAKLDVRDRARAVVYAYEHGLVSPQRPAPTSGRAVGDA